LKELQCNSNQLISLDSSGLSNLQILYCYSNQLSSLNVSGLTSLLVLHCYSNQLTSIPTLISKNSISAYNFIHNNFQTAELDRFRAMGFTNESKLVPQHDIQID
jgi:Leucine-rich repeat (LRR) protein